MNYVIAEAVADALRKQKWYQKYANTIVAGITLLISILSFVVSLELGFSPLVAAGIPVVVQALGTLATKLTRNGIQPSTAGKLVVPETPPAVLAERLRTGSAGRHALVE